MSSTCIFCKIVSGEIPATRVYEDDQVIAFHDIRPAAPVHVLVMPKQHLVSIQDVSPGNADLLGKLIAAVQHVAREKGIDRTGYRVVTNSGRDAGQEVFHLHLHVMGGKPLGPIG